MAHRNLSRKPSKENLSESEEGEIEDCSPKNKPHDQDDSSSESSEDEGALDIKPPPALMKSEISRRDHKKRSKHRRHNSHREDRHHGRNSHSDQSAVRDREYSKNRKSETDIYYRGDRDKRREDIRNVKVVREIRLNKDIRESRVEGNDAKPKEEKCIDSFDLKKKEWREKRLNFVEKKRAESRNQPDSSKSTKESIYDGNDLRNKLRDKERLQKERRLERFRGPPEGVKRIQSTVVVSTKVEEPPKNPEPTVNEEPMELEEESDKQNVNGKAASGSETESSTDSESGSDTDSKSEASSQSSDEKMEETDDDGTADESSNSSSSESEEEEEKADKVIEPAENVADPVPTNLKPESKVKNVFSPYLPAIEGCRSVDEFNSLSRIEEGTYGVVYRAKEKATGEIVALKRLKMEKEKEGFPITSLREINTLLKAQHQNIVSVREIVVGSNIDRIYIVMDYVEHDMKSLMKTMTKPFSFDEVKDLMTQLLRAVDHLHDNWILHRDLKPSNLLLSHKGTLKVGDFGLAREYGSPLKSYTPVVVTLWYRAPELLLGVKKYSTAIDMWSVGCIFAELLTLKPLFPGESEMDQLKKVFKELGTPSEKIWPGFDELPLVKKLSFANYPYNRLKHSLPPKLSDDGFDLINKLLTYNPNKRITAENALSHVFIEQKQELQGEVNEKNTMAEAVARFNFPGSHSEQSSKGGGFTLKF